MGSKWYFWAKYSPAGVAACGEHLPTMYASDLSLDPFSHAIIAHTSGHVYERKKSVGSQGGGVGKDTNTEQDIVTEKKGGSNLRWGSPRQQGLPVLRSLSSFDPPLCNVTIKTVLPLAPDPGFV